MSNDGSGYRPSTGERMAQDWAARKLMEVANGRGAAVSVDRDRLARIIGDSGSSGDSDRVGAEMSEQDKRERLAAVAHWMWAHWMSYMFTCGTFHEDGTWTMPASKAERWLRQMVAAYDALSEAEKDSDREMADKILDALGES